jgi:hypothetical protein
VLRWLELEPEAHGVDVSWERDFPATADAEARLAGEVVAAEAGPRAWQSVGEALNPMMEVVWHHLADDERRLFFERYRSRFMSHWVPIPLVTAHEVLRLLRGRKARAIRGGANRSRGDAGGPPPRESRSRSPRRVAERSAGRRSSAVEGPSAVTYP